MILYHATKAKFINDIKEHGLKPQNTDGNKGQIKDGFLHFSSNIDDAISCNKKADDKSEQWKNEKIMVLAVSSNILSEKNLISDHETSIIAYKGQIQPELLFAINCETNSGEPLICVNEFMPKYHYD